MELYERILCETLAREILPSLELDAKSLVEMKCYQAIVRIYEVLNTDSLTDRECFDRIEEIVTARDFLGTGAGSRHDF